MKKLLLVRHAKAANEKTFSDFERPLTHSGMADAITIAGRLHSLGHIPQVIITSPALRTLSTANVFTEHLSLPETQTDLTIYDATGDSLVDVVNSLPAEYDFVAIVGHNPGMAQLLHFFSSEIKEMPTCAIALIIFDVDDWRQVCADAGTLIYYDEP